MTISRAAYRQFTATAINARLSNTCTHSVNGTNVDCTDCTCEKIEDILGITHANATNTSHFDDADINHWSCWGPTIRSLSGSGYTAYIVNSHYTGNRGISNAFCGYNHSASTPGWQSGGQATAQATIWVNSGSKATCSAPIDIGEVDYAAHWGATGIAMLIFDSGDNIVGWGYTSLSSVANTFTLYGETINNVSIDTSGWYGRALIVDQVITDPEDVISAMVCTVPNITTWTIDINVKALSEWHFEGSGTQTLPSPWDSTAGSDGGMNWTTGVITVNYYAYNPNDYTNVHCYAKIFDWTWTQVGSQAEIFNATYYAYDEMYGSDDVGMTNIAAYGYHVVVYIDLTS